MVSKPYTGYNIIDYNKITTNIVQTKNYKQHEHIYENRASGDRPGNPRRDGP